MKNRKSVYVYGYYGSGNFGDDLLLTTVLNRLKEKNFAEKYYIKNSDSIEFLLDESNVIQTNVEKYIIHNKTILQKTRGVLNYFFEHYKILKNCHSVVFGGGTLLNAYKSSKTLFLIAIIITIAKTLNVNVYGIGLGIGKMKSPISKTLLTYILNSFNYLGLRDEKSFEMATSLSSNVNIELTADLSFSNNLPLNKFNKNLNSNKIIAISIVGAFIEKDKYSTFIDMIYQVILYCKQNGYDVKFYSFQEGSYSDCKIFQDIIKKYVLEDIEIEYLNISDKNLNQKFQDLDLFIGMRYHGIVLSSINNTPFVGFSPDHKVHDICQHYNMPFHNINNITLEWVVNAINTAINLPLSKNIEKKLMSLSLNNWNFLDKKWRK